MHGGEIPGPTHSISHRILITLLADICDWNVTMNNEHTRIWKGAVTVFSKVASWLPSTQTGKKEENSNVVAVIWQRFELHTSPIQHRRFAYIDVRFQSYIQILNSIILHCHVLPSEDQSFKRKT
jgi:hypothetical protein